MESAEAGQNIPIEDTSKCVVASDSTEKERRKQTSETNTCQESGIYLSQDTTQTPKQVPTKTQGSQARTQPPYLTSTPKKKLLDLAGESGYEIISSQMILEDPLLTSIDEPGYLMDHQAKSLISDDDAEESTSMFHTTKIRARVDASQKEHYVYKRMNDISNHSQLLSETIQQHVVEANATSVKKNLFDIPVSPKLKNRVRERLYTLVNSIEGFEDRVCLKDETSSHSHNMESLSKVDINNPNSTKVNMNTFSKLPGHSPLNVSSHQQKSLHDHSNVSPLSCSIIEQYNSALSSIVGSQLNSLRYDQEQLNKEKLSLAVQKKEQETNARISVYHEKLQLMVQMVEDLDLKLIKSRAAAREDAEHYERRLREREEQQQEELATLRAECSRKIEKAEAQTRSAQVAADQTCEQRISEVLSTMRVRFATLEKEHEAQITGLNSTISKLRAEKSVFEASLEDSTPEAVRAELVTRTPLLQGGRDAILGESSLKKQTNFSRTGSGLHEDLLSIDLMKKKIQEEVEFWKRETERLQKKLYEADAVERKLISDTFQDLHSKSMTDPEQLRIQTAGESEGLTALRERLSQTVNENIALKQKLNDCQIKEVDLRKKLSFRDNEASSLQVQLRCLEMEVLQEKKNLKECEEHLAASQEHHKQTMLTYQLGVERKTAAAVSAALTHHQERTRLLLADLRACYEKLVRRILTHSRAQINEYKKAVRYLKQRNKITEKG